MLDKQWEGPTIETLNNMVNARHALATKLGYNSYQNYYHYYCFFFDLEYIFTYDTQRESIKYTRKCN